MSLCVLGRPTGHVGTTQNQCESSGCCWEPTKVSKCVKLVACDRDIVLTKISRILECPGVIIKLRTCQHTLLIVSPPLHWV